MTFYLLSSVFLVLAPGAMPAVGQEDATAKVGFEALRNEYWQGLPTKDQELTTDQDRAKFEEAYLERRGHYARRFLDLASQHADDPAVVGQLIWFLASFGSTAEADRAVDQLIEKHLAHEELPSAIRNMATQPFPAAKRLLR